MWTIYVILVFLLAILVVSTGTTAAFYIFGSDVQTWLPSPTPTSTSTMYSCQSTGVCQVSEDGSFSTLEDCTEYCDHAQCIIIGVNAQCSHTPGNMDTPSVSECQETCGQGDVLSYVCDTTQGCRLASSTETAVYVDSTCDNECRGYDMSSNGLCELVPLNGASPKYDGQSSCENANYTWSCTDYTRTNDTGAPFCTMDAGIVEGNSTDQSSCLSVCNPDHHPTCGVDSAYSYSDTTYLEGQTLASACTGFVEGNACIIEQSQNGSIIATYEGKCTYCARTGGISDLYCSPPFTFNSIYTDAPMII